MQRAYLFLAIVVVCLWTSSDALARGGRGGARGGAMRGGGFSGGGGVSRPSVSRTPSMSRPAMPNYSRPAMPSTRPNLSRPSISPSSVTRPGVTGPSPGISRPTSPGVGARPSTGARPNVGTRPSSSQLRNFLDLPSSGGPRPSQLPASRPGNLAGGIAAGVAGGMAGSAAADFLRDSGPRPGTLPAERPGVGNRPGTLPAERPGIGNRPGVGTLPAQRPGIGNRPGIADRPLVSNRPERIQNRGDRQDLRQDRRNQIRDQIDHTPIRDFWSDHPLWGAWAISRPYRWAAWGGVSGWVNYGWTEPVYYDYGVNVYYQDGSVYYNDEVVATEEEYAQQAEGIIASAPDVAPEQGEWMPLGVFALTPDGQQSGPEPTLFLQLVISKQGVISGTLNNLATNSTQTIEGMVDKNSQRAAWNVTGKSRPIMETGIANLTKDTAPALVHFADGTTQQWLMVRLDDPEGQQR